MDELIEKTMTEEQKAMIEEFQCPGCTCGYKTGECDQYSLQGLLKLKVEHLKLWVDSLLCGMF